MEAVARPTRSAGELCTRWVAIGAGALGLVGGIVGLVVGLDANPRTAWFAILELGIPASMLGGLVGFCGALLVLVGRRLDRRSIRAHARDTFDA